MKDLAAVLQRSQSYGIERIMVTVGSLSDSHEAAALIKELEPKFPGMLTTTIGVHPTRVNEFDAFIDGPEAHLEELRKLGRRHKELSITAVGEFGLGIKTCSLSNNTEPPLRLRSCRIQLTSNSAKIL